MGTVNIVCEGDSIMEGFPLPAGQDMPTALQVLLDARGVGTYVVTNVGFRNRTMQEIDSGYAARVDPEYDATAEYNILIVWGGGNDGFFNTGQQAATIAATDSVVGKAQATGFDQIYLMNIIQRGSGGATTIAVWRTESTAINANFDVLAAANTDVDVIDIKSLYNSYDWIIDPWTSASASVRSEYEDWAHPTYVSHQAEAVVIEPIIQVATANYAGTLPLDDGTTRYDVPYYDDYTLGDAGPVVSNSVGHYRLGTVASGGQAYVDDGGGVATRVQLETV